MEKSYQEQKELDEEGALFNILDEAIDDIENGRTLSNEQMWKEIDKMGM